MVAVAKLVCALSILCLVSLSAAEEPTCANYQDYLKDVKPCLDEGICGLADKDEKAESTFCTVYELAEEMFYNDALDAMTAIADWNENALKQLSALSVFYTGRASRFDEVKPDQESFKSSVEGFNVSIDKDTATDVDMVPCIAPSSPKDVCNYSWAYAAKAMLDTAYKLSIGDDCNFSLDYIKNCVFDEEAICSMDLTPADMLGILIQHQIPQEDGFIYDADANKPCELDVTPIIPGEFVIHTPEQPNRGGLMNLIAAMPTMALVGVKMDQLRFTGKAQPFSDSYLLRPLTEQSDQPNLYALAQGYHTFPQGVVDTYGIERVGMWFLQTRPLSCFSTYLNLPMLDTDDDGNFAGVAAYAVGLTFLDQRNLKINKILVDNGYYSETDYSIIFTASDCSDPSFYIQHEWFDGVNYLKHFKYDSTCKFSKGGVPTDGPPTNLPFECIGCSGGGGGTVPEPPTMPPDDPMDPAQQNIDDCDDIISNQGLGPGDSAYVDHKCKCWDVDAMSDYLETVNIELFVDPTRQCQYSIAECPNGSAEKDSFPCNDGSRRLQSYDGKKLTYSGYQYVTTIVVNYQVDNTITEIVFKGLPSLRTIQFGENEAETTAFLKKVNKLEFGNVKNTVTTLIFKGAVFNALAAFPFHEFSNLKEIYISGTSVLPVMTTLNLSKLKYLEKVTVRGEYALRRVKKIEMTESFRKGYDTTFSILNGAMNGATSLDIVTRADGADAAESAKNGLYRMMIAGYSQPNTAGFLSLAKVASLDLSPLPNLRAFYYMPNEDDESISKYDIFDTRAVISGDSEHSMLTTLKLNGGQYRYMEITSALTQVTSFEVEDLKLLRKVTITGDKTLKSCDSLLFTGSFDSNFPTTFEADETFAGDQDELVISGGNVASMNFTGCFAQRKTVELRGSEAKKLHLVAKEAKNFPDTERLNLINMEKMEEFIIRGSGAFPALKRIRVKGFFRPDASFTGIQVPPDWTGDIIFGNMEMIEFCDAADHSVADDIATKVEVSPEQTTC